MNHNQIPGQLNLQQLLTGKGVAGLHDQPTPEGNRPAPEQYEMAQKVKRVFAGKDGEDVLNWMLKFGVWDTAWDPFSLPVDQATVIGFFKEGQKSVVREVTNQIAIANGPGPKDPTTEDEQGEDHE